MTVRTLSEAREMIAKGNKLEDQTWASMWFTLVCELEDFDQYGDEDGSWEQDIIDRVNQTLETHKKVGVAI